MHPCCFTYQESRQPDFNCVICEHTNWLHNVSVMSLGSCLAFQVETPQNLSASEPSSGQEVGKLRVLETLLWNDGASSDRRGTLSSLIRAANHCVLNALSASAMRCLAVDVAAVEVTYRQVGQPGPLRSQPQCRSLDELVVAIRSARFAPANTGSASGG